MKTSYIFQWNQFKGYPDAELTIGWFAAWVRQNGDFKELRITEQFAEVITIGEGRDEYMQFRTLLADRFNNEGELSFAIPPAMEDCFRKGLLPDQIAPDPKIEKQQIPIFRNEYRVPMIICGLPRINITTYENGDVGFGFKNSIGIKVDAFLYGSDRGNIPTDVASPELDQCLFHETQALIDLGMHSGNINYELTNKILLDSPLLKVPIFSWVSMRYRAKNPIPGEYEPFISHIAMRTDAGYLNKVRCSYRDQGTELNQVSLACLYMFLQFWFSDIQKNLKG